MLKNIKRINCTECLLFLCNLKDIFVCDLRMGKMTFAQVLHVIQTYHLTYMIRVLMVLKLVQICKYWLLYQLYEIMISALKNPHSRKRVGFHYFDFYCFKVML